MTIRVAINGFGRIGRNILRALYENAYRSDIEIVAINDLSDPKTSVHLLNYDSVHGTFSKPATLNGSQLCIEADRIEMLSCRSLDDLPWRAMNIDMVFECTGAFTSRNAAAKHLDAGAKRVLISAPGEGVDLTVVYGVNHEQLNASHQVVSNASCTTNCLAPIAQILDQSLGIESGLMTTIHAITNDQNLTDVYHKDLYRARSALQSMIPTKTGAAAAIGQVLPNLSGKLDGLAVRVPLVNVSLVDFSFISKRDTSQVEVNRIMQQASQTSAVLKYNDLPLVSIDFNHNAASSVFDASHTKVIGRHVKIMAWYDNEWGFSNRMLDTGKYWGEHVDRKG